MSFIKIDQVSKKYDASNALKEISLDIAEGENIAIVGETGSGKSTLLKIIGGLLETNTGQVLYQEEKIIGPLDKLIPGHEEIIYLSQHFTLPKSISVFEHLDSPYSIGEEDAKKIYEACRIEHLMSKNTQALSGGEKQRVALAKALTKLPEVLLLDEPFSNLDFIHKQIIKEVLDDVGSNWETTIIMVSHEPRDVLPWADAIVVMRKGDVVQIDTPKEIYNKPKNEYVAGLFGKYNLLDMNNWRIQKGHSFSQTKQKVIVRPEQVMIKKKNGEGMVGEILHIKYHGNYNEIIVNAANQKVNIETNANSFKVGDQVSIHV